MFAKHTRAHRLHASSIAACMAWLLGTPVITHAADTPQATDGGASIQSYFRNGLRYVDGKPYFSTAAFFGLNHWMAPDEPRGTGYFMGISADRVGAADDFYTLSGFNTGYYSIWGHTWLNGKPFDPALFREAIRRTGKIGQKMVVHLPVVFPAEIARKLGAVWVTETGEKIDIGSIWGMCHDPDMEVKALRETYQQVFDAIRDEPNLVGYQLGAERWCYDYVRLKKDVSFDEYSLGEFRKYLQAQYSLQDVAKRYGISGGSYADWSSVMPPVSTKGKDFAQRDISNWSVARWDWYRFRDYQTSRVWIRMIREFQAMDGRGRPFSFEYGHGPYYSMGFNPFQATVAEVSNFSVGNGDFAGDVAGTLLSLSQVKGCGKGPWTNNELDAGTSNRRFDAADQRRKIWANIALGVSGYHLWTFFNLMGANSEFMDNTWYDPKLRDNLPLRFYEVQQANRAISGMSELLAESKAPAPSLAMLLLDDSLFLNNLINDYRPEARGLANAIVAGGLGDQFVGWTSWHAEHEDLSKVKTIVLPRMPRITDGHAATLAKFVRNGGTLVMIGPTGLKNELFENQAVAPYGDLGEASGITMAPIPAKEIKSVPITGSWGSEAITMDVQARLTLRQGSNAEIVARNGDIAMATVNRYGKGLCITLAGYPIVLDPADGSASLWRHLVGLGGIKPAAAVTTDGGRRTDTGVFTGRRQGTDYSMLFVVETGDTSHTSVVTIDQAAFGLKGATASVIDCADGSRREISQANNWSFPLELEPVGIRVYAISDGPAPKRIRTQEQPAYLSGRPGVVLESIATAGLPYTTSSAWQERDAWLRGRRISAAEVRAKDPMALPDGYLALDLSPWAATPLQRMIKSVDPSAFVNFGADAKAKAANAGITDGVNTVGGVPFLSCGRYIANERFMETRGIPVGASVTSLSFFHGAAKGQDAGTLGYYRVNYRSGESLRIPITIGVTITDYSRVERFPSRTTLVAKLPAEANQTVSVTRFDWPNPRHDDPIVSIDIVALAADDTRTFDVWAITARR